MLRGSGVMLSPKPTSTCSGIRALPSMAMTFTRIPS